MQFIRVNKKIIIIVLVILLAMVALGVYLYKKNNKPESKYPDSLHQPYSGPTEDEKKQADSHKDEVLSQMKQDEQTSNSSKRQVSPEITNVNQNGQTVEVMSYVSGIFEDGGKCTIVATKGNDRVAKEVEAFADATTTSCAPASIALTEFPSKGMWSFMVTYASSNAQGTSKARTLQL